MDLSQALPIIFRLGLMVRNICLRLLFVLFFQSFKQQILYIKVFWVLPFKKGTCLVEKQIEICSTERTTIEGGLDFPWFILPYLVYICVYSPIWF